MSRSSWSLVRTARNDRMQPLTTRSGADEVMLMSRDFEVVYEAPLRTEEFGEGQPHTVSLVRARADLPPPPADEMINVGWGSKKTQFHGSIGKAAQLAQPAAASLLPLAPPEDGAKPGITWRGDGAYFAVSSLDEYSAGSSRPGGRRRQVRVYQRTPCALSATSEPVHGLQGAPEGPTSGGGGLVAWRPAGNLMAGVKRYGYEGGAEGEGGADARRDVVFFERNGLVHGGFRLREDERVRSGKQDASWDVVGLAYSASSDVLAIHISRNDTDVGESLVPRRVDGADSCSSTMDHEQLPLLFEIRALPTERRELAFHVHSMASGKGKRHLPRGRR